MSGKLPLTIIGLASAAAFALPGSAAGQSPGVDSAVGDVITVSFRPEAFTFDAHSGPSGEDPSGTATWGDRSALLAGPVTCLTVTGNRATIGFEDEHHTPEGGFLFVEDNGMPGIGQDKAVGQILAVAPTVCPPNTVVYDPLNTVTSGELTVHDAPALPTSKDQCKNGGWRNFPGFKNQGQCVGFVATGGMHHP